MNINPERVIETDVNNVVVWKDLDGKFLGCNEKFATMMDITPGQVIGLTDYDLSFTSQEANGYRAADKKVLATKITEQFQEIATFACGKKEMLAIKTPIINHMSKIVGVIITSYILRQISNNASPGKCLEINGEKITQCEMKILNLLVRGKTAKEIGNALYISNRTVETYLDRIKNKLNVSTKSQLIDLVFDYIF